MPPDSDDLRCDRCGSQAIVHVRRKRRSAGKGAWRNRCTDCGAEGEYIPNQREIQAACQKLRALADPHWAAWRANHAESEGGKNDGAENNRDQFDGDSDAAECGAAGKGRSYVEVHCGEVAPCPGA